MIDSFSSLFSFDRSIWPLIGICLLLIAAMVLAIVIVFSSDSIIRAG